MAQLLSLDRLPESKDKATGNGNFPLPDIHRQFCEPHCTQYYAPQISLHDWLITNKSKRN